MSSATKFRRILHSVTGEDKSAGRNFSGRAQLVFFINYGSQIRKLAVTTRFAVCMVKIGKVHRPGGGPHPAYLCRRPCVGQMGCAEINYAPHYTEAVTSHVIRSQYLQPSNSAAPANLQT